MNSRLVHNRNARMRAKLIEKKMAEQGGSDTPLIVHVKKGCLVN